MDPRDNPYTPNAGARFAFVGRQVHLKIDDQDFYVDLLLSNRYGSRVARWAGSRQSCMIAVPVRS